MVDLPEFITQKLQREVNSLSDDNRGVRKLALEKICKQVVTCKDSSQVILNGLLDVLLKPLLKVFSDPVEKCRDLAIGFFIEVFPLLEDITGFLPYIFPVVVARMGTQDITEPSEEIRLNLVTFLTSIVSRSGADIAPYLSDVIIILQKTIVDPYPEVKKESCVCSMKIAEATPATFYHQSESLVKPLLITMTYRHYKVRMASIKAMGTTILYGSPKFLDDGLTILAQRACDSTPSVRLCLANVVGHWLLELPDRYSYHHKLVPLLLTCLGDELSEIRNRSHELWKQIGAKYQLENEDELKDRIDFIQHVPPAACLEFPRPGLGCRVLVYRCFSKILPAILQDMVDWTDHSRIKSVQLLFTLLYHLEDRATHHIQVILNGLFKACGDKESTVTNQAVLCCKVLGYYVFPEVWCKLVLPAVRNSAGCSMNDSSLSSIVAVGSVQCTCCLKVLFGLVHGSTPEGVESQLESIVDCISETEVGNSDHLPLLCEILNIVLLISERAGGRCEMYSLKLFTTVLRISVSKHAQALTHRVNESLTALAKAQNLNETSDLFFNHSQDIISFLKAGYMNWNIHSSDCYLFGSVLSGAGPILGQLLEDVIPILSFCLNTKREPEMRLHFITLLIRLLMDSSWTLNSEKLFSKFSSHVVSEILLPNLVWKAGRTAAAIRTAAMTGLLVWLQSKECSTDLLKILSPDLLPQVLSCLDDDNESTRLVSCKVLRNLFFYKCFDVDQLHMLHCDLLKRLDDSSDVVRIEITRTLNVYIEAFPDDYDKSMYRVHLEALFKGLLVHLDDPSPNIQEAVLGVLKLGVKLDRDLLKEQVELVQDKHRGARWCQQILHILVHDDVH